MSKIPLALTEIHRAENHLGAELRRVSDRNKADHEIFYVAADIARWSEEHVREVARIGREHGLELDPEPDHGSGLLAKARQKGDEMLGRHHEASMSLLVSLRDVHVSAAGLSLDWEVLAQTAQALKDRQLLSLAQDCHPQTLRQMRWANAKVKELSAQIMVTP